MSETVQNEAGGRCLIELAAEGDSEAIREIVDRHQAMVYGTCLRIHGNESDAEDAAQATFILFLRKCRKLKRGTVLSSWLYRTARFVSREHIRKSARRKRREIAIATVALSAALAKNASAAAVPASLAPAIASAATSGAVATAGSATAALMVKGALAKMTWIKTQVAALVGVVATAGVLLGIHGLQLSSRQVDALDFTEEQTAKANAVMASHRADYLAIEEKHVTMFREEADLVHFKVAPFPKELNELTESFWREFDAICDERQRRVARRCLVLSNLFPLGEHPVEVRMEYDGKLYSVNQKITRSPVLHDVVEIQTDLNASTFCLHGLIPRDTATIPDEQRGRESVLSFEAVVSAV
jgi:RNA polymerase sigma factor (sigma-70 family)